MKKSLALILGLCIFLSACTAGNGPETIGDPTTTPPTSSQTTATTAPAETGGADETVAPSRPDGTQPIETSEPTEATRPAATVPSNKEDTDTPKQTEPKETDLPVTTQPSTDSPETQPPVTNPPETHPSETQPPETKLEETEPPTTQPTVTDPTTSQEKIAEPTEPATEPIALDFDAAEAYGNAYGVNTYQWVADPSLTMENAGFNFPDTVSMARLQENGGQEYLNRIVKEGVDALYTTLSLYGSPEGCRINCHIELQNSDTVTIYILYG